MKKEHTRKTSGKFEGEPTYKSEYTFIGNLSVLTIIKIFKLFIEFFTCLTLSAMGLSLDLRLQYLLLCL